MLDLTSPPPHPLVAASILSADFGEMAADCRDVLDHGADLLHLDVMDGHFVPNLTMGADMIRCLRRHFPDVYLDVHLMVERPGEYVESFARAGANNFCFHLEMCAPVHPAGLDPEEVHGLIRRIHDAGMNAGMAVNPYTPIDPVGPYLESLDLVLVMSVVPGRSGQAFMPQVLDKTRWLKERLPERTRLEMDGGLNPDTAPQAVAASADVLVTASALFGQPRGKARARVIEALHSSS